MHRSVRRRSLAAAAAVVAAILTLSACGSSSDEGSKPSSGFTPGELNRDYAGTTISVLMPPWAQMPKEQVAKFTEETGIEVDLQSLDFEAIHDKIVTSGASNIAPADVVEVDSSWWASSVQRSGSPRLISGCLRRRLTTRSVSLASPLTATKSRSRTCWISAARWST